MPGEATSAAAGFLREACHAATHRNDSITVTDARSQYQDHLLGAPVEVKSRVLIIVQNLPVPFDRRVWLECQALISAGYRVAVVCPKGRGDPAYEVIDSVELYKYRPYAPGGSKFSFVAEYAYSFLATAWTTLKARRSGRFAVIQACNPPDIFWPLALAFRAVEGTRFVFDHHDLCPELYESRFPGGAKLPYKGLLALERRTHRAADHVIATNDSYREIAMTRGGKSADGRHGRPYRPGSAAAQARRGRPRAAPGPPVPRRLHRGHGPAGRGGHRGAGRRHRGPQARPRRHRLHVDRLRGLLRRAGGIARRARPGGPRGVHRAGAG